VVPATAGQIKIAPTNAYNNSTFSLMGIAPNSNYSGIQSTNPPRFACPAATASMATFSMVLEATTVSWFSSQAGGGMFCAGWTDYYVGV